MADNFTGFLPYKHIQLCNKAILFKNRNKIIWRYQSFLWMYPPDKRFRACHLFTEQIIFWLKIDMELSVFKRLHHIVCNLLFKIHLLSYGFIIIKDIFAIISFSALYCTDCTVTHNLNIL